MGYTRADWSEHYSEGRGFRGLGDEERSLLVKHAPAPRAAAPWMPAPALASWRRTLPRSGTASTASTSPKAPWSGLGRSMPAWRGCAGCAWIWNTTI